MNWGGNFHVCDLKRTGQYSLLVQPAIESLNTISSPQFSGALERAEHKGGENDGRIRDGIL
jgi:hypothetical protein